MMYMDDAVKATLDLMEAPAEKVKIRSSYNIGAMSFARHKLRPQLRNTFRSLRFL